MGWRLIDVFHHHARIGFQGESSFSTLATVNIDISVFFCSCPVNTVALAGAREVVDLIFIEDDGRGG